MLSYHSIHGHIKDGGDEKRSEVVQSLEVRCEPCGFVVGKHWTSCLWCGICKGKIYCCKRKDQNKLVVHTRGCRGSSYIVFCMTIPKTCFLGIDEKKETLFIHDQ